MGLDTSHDCFHGAYSSFYRWRTAIANAGGYPTSEDGRSYLTLDLDRFEEKNFDGQWDSPPDDPLLILLIHSDCDGEIPAEFCEHIATRLEQLLPALSEEGSGHLSAGIKAVTQRFIDGLRLASSLGEAVDFH